MEFACAVLAQANNAIIYTKILTIPSGVTPWTAIMVVPFVVSRSFTKKGGVTKYQQRHF